MANLNNLKLTETREVVNFINYLKTHSDLDIGQNEEGQWYWSYRCFRSDEEADKQFDSPLAAVADFIIDQCQTMDLLNEE